MYGGSLPTGRLLSAGVLVGAGANQGPGEGWSDALSGERSVPETAPSRWPILLTGLLVLGLVAAGGLYWRSQSESSSSDPCGDAAPTRVTVATAPDFGPVLEEATQLMAEQPGWCAEYDVVVAAPNDILEELGSRSSDAPDLWIPDSSTWHQQLIAAGVPTRIVRAAVAASPVVLAGGPAADPVRSWRDALSSGRLAMRDPLTSGAGATALLSPRAEREKSKITDEELRALLVPLAQRYGARKADGKATDIKLSSIRDTSSALVPATEQEYLQAEQQNRSLRAVTPGTGSVLALYPLLTPTASSPEVVQAGRDLASFLATPSGLRLLEKHSFRNEKGDPLEGGVGVGDIDLLKLPAAQDLDDDLRLWSVLGVPSSLLAVFDASGSMLETTPDGSTRAELMVNAATTAVGLFPDSARIGLWLFSIDQGGKGQDWRQLSPIRRLDTKVGKVTHREDILKFQAELDRSLGGGTGLYDTALAAFRQAQRDYDPNYFNSVVLLTDGANDDPGSIRLEDLLKQLRTEADPERPVRIIGIGLSDDADMEALGEIAAATDSRAYQAADPRDILEVFTQALLSR